MNIENIKQGGIITEQVSEAFKRGEIEKALQIMEQNFGPAVKGLLENVIKYTNLSTDELGGIFGKISDFLERAAEKITNNERLMEKISKERQAHGQAESIADLAALKMASLERQQRFEDRINWIEEQKRKIAEEKKRLEEQKKREKDIAKRREIEKKLKEVEKRRQTLEEERKKLAELKKENDAARQGGSFRPAAEQRQNQTPQAKDGQKPSPAAVPAIVKQQQERGSR